MTDLSIITAENVAEAIEEVGSRDAAKIARYLLEMKRAPKEATDLVQSYLDADEPSEEPEVDEADEAEEEISGSIVGGEYKQKYAEQGHADDCGDWLADLLRDRFETQTTLPNGKTKPVLDRKAWSAFLTDNGLSPGKWSHLNNGQLRMTGDNALRSQIVRNGGTLLLDGKEHKAPKAWMAEKLAKIRARETERRAKVKTVPAKKGGRKAKAA